MPLIRDTIDPDREREVSDEEFVDLERMGLLLDTGRTRAKTVDGLRAAAVRQVLERRDETAAAAAVPDLEDEDEDVVDDQGDEDEDHQDPGDVPDSNAPDTTDTPES